MLCWWGIFGNSWRVRKSGCKWVGARRRGQNDTKWFHRHFLHVFWLSCCLNVFRLIKFPAKLLIVASTNFDSVGPCRSSGTWSTQQIQMSVDVRRAWFKSVQWTNNCSLDLSFSIWKTWTHHALQVEKRSIRLHDLNFPSARMSNLLLHDLKTAEEELRWAWE